MLVKVWGKLKQKHHFLILNYILRVVSFCRRILVQFLSQAVQAGTLVGAIAFGAIDPAFAGDVGAGQQIFGANCAACHAGGQNVITPKKTLEKDALDQYLVDGRSEESIMTLVTNGKNAMPAFGGRLDNDQISNVCHAKAI